MDAFDEDGKRSSGAAQAGSPVADMTNPDAVDDRSHEAADVSSPSMLSRGTTWMVVGAFVAGVGVYLFQAIGTRSLGDVAFAPISALWTIQYLVVSVALFPIETYVAHRTLLGPDERELRSALVRLSGWVAVVAIAVTGITWVWREQLFHGIADLPLVAGAITGTFGAFMIVRGRLVGEERFKAYGLVTATESAGRAVLAAGVTLVVSSTQALAWTMPLGALAAASLWFVVRRRHRPPSESHDATPLSAGRFLAITTGANAILQALLAGGPLVLALLGALPSQVSVLFVTLTAARVPVLFLFSGLLSRLLPTFLRLGRADDGRELRRAAMWVALAALGCATVGGLLAGAIGGPVLGFLFGDAFAPPGWVAAGTTAGALLATGSMILNQVLVAQGFPARSLVAWLVALVAAAAALFILGGSPTQRVVGAFVVAEGVALFALVLATHRPPRRVQVVGDGTVERSG
jgi:O-antigen/teichoic acid export membrane protein